MPEITPEMLRTSAMNLLAQREFTIKELVRKLSLLTDDESMVDAVLDRLEAERLLSDDRFVESFIRSRINKGHGLMRIKQDLRQKGVDSETADLAMEEAEIDWYKLAEAARQKKFGIDSPSDPKEKARQVRFLQYRGFPVGVIMELF